MNSPAQKPELPAGRAKKGFALVATLSIIALITILTIGLLGLSRTSLRRSTQDKAQAEAQANARMAMMVALGDLQKHAGPDRRISAKAEILDETPASGLADNVSNPHYLGIWDSWDTWLTDKKGSLSIQDTYKRGRDPSLFRAWLVSHPDSAKYETAILNMPAADWIELCGKNSAGPDVANHVKVPRVPLKNGNRITGNYAWWVSDESMKARLDLKARESATTLSAAQLASSQTGRTGIEKMTAMSTFDTRPASLPKMVTTQQAGLSAPGISGHFHNITAYSTGLLTDVRSGGFKCDLNLAFESDNIPSEMGQARLFSGRPFDAPIRPLTGELSKIEPQNPYVAPMSWRQMREYYRLYRDFAGGTTSTFPVQWKNGIPETKRFLMGKPSNFWDTKGYARQIVVLNQTWVLATYSQEVVANNNTRTTEYYLLAIPIIHLWNPYNVTITANAAEFSSLGGLTSSIELTQRTYHGNTFFRESRFPESDTSTNRTLTGNQHGYRMVPTESNPSQSVEFKPGEVRIFSTDARVQTASGLLNGAVRRGGSDRYFFASPGYTPIQSQAGAIRGLAHRIYPPANPNGPLSLALRLGSDFADGVRENNYFGLARNAMNVHLFQEVNSAGNNGLFYESGAKVGAEEWQDVAYIGHQAVEWVASDELTGSWLIPDTPATRIRWGPPGGTPLPVAIISISAKTADLPQYAQNGSFTADFRNRTWLHAPPTGLSNFLRLPDGSRGSDPTVSLLRADSPYQVHFRPVNGDQEVSQYLQADGRNGYYGGSYSAAAGQPHIAPLSIPVVPPTNLGSFAGVRIDHARAGIFQKDDTYPNPTVDRSMSGRNYEQNRHMAHAGGAFGPGIGNAYAHPMLQPDKVYTRTDLGKDLGFIRTNGQSLVETNLNVSDDHWDHLFLANEELWDSWFCSGIAPVMNNGSVVTSKKTVAENFFSNVSAPLSPHFQPDKRGKTAQQLANLVETTTAQTGGNGWDLIGSYLLNRGQFNVNSTSKEAWKALLMSLANRPIACNDPKSGTSVIPADANQASLARHPLANGASAATGPGDENAWRGIRKLTEPQIDKLADEIVRQVKLRGPFLNMTEFINRRLSTDDTGVVGALQAAIDWDEFNAGYDGSTSGSGESINKNYKGSGDMISTLPANYPNPKAARGSRYAGIPGYVMQSDILQGISSSLGVRGDTFVIRTYGESFTADGKVAANAWCEAVVQRMPEYMDPTDATDKKMRVAGKLPGETATLAPLNQAFGRQFRITSFRWLNKDEI